MKDSAVPDILLNKSQSLKKKKESRSLILLSDSINIAFNTKVEGSYLRNCDQVTTGLVVAVPLLETKSSNLLAAVGYPKLCRSKTCQTGPGMESLHYRGRKGRV